MVNENKLQIAKDIIKEWYHQADCGLFFCRGMFGDSVCPLYDNRDIDLTIFICFYWAYFVVIGLTSEEETELKKYYESLRKENN